MIYAFETDGEPRAPRKQERFLGSDGSINVTHVAFSADDVFQVLRPIPQAEIEEAQRKIAVCEEADRARDWWVGRARCLTEERDSLMRELEEMKRIAAPTWTDIWVCPGCGKRSTDLDDTAGLWRWLGDRYEHGCVGEGQSRIYEPARFFGKVNQEEFDAQSAAMKEAERVRDWWVERAKSLDEERKNLRRELEETKALLVKQQQEIERLRTYQHARDDDRTRFIRDTAARLIGTPIFDESLSRENGMAIYTCYRDHDRAIEDAKKLADALFEEPHQ